jgi:hypothetical protein
MMKFILLDIQYSIFCGSLFFEICLLKPKDATYRAGIGPPHHKAPG